MEEIIVVSLCLVLNAILAAYEMAFVSAPRSELRRLVACGNKYANLTLSLRENPERTLSIIQVGITLVGAIAAAAGGAGAAEIVEPYLMHRFRLNQSTAEWLAIVVVVLPITYLNVVLAELVPKSLALKNPTRILLAGAKWFVIADRLLSPVISLLEWSTKRVISVIIPRSTREKSEVNQAAAIELDNFSPTHRRLILNVVQLESRPIKEIMIPWAEVDAIDFSSSIEVVHRLVLSSGHTRLPVVDNSIGAAHDLKDRKPKILGMMHSKEYATLRDSGERDWTSIIRQPILANPKDLALNTLRLMQSKRTHMAIVMSGEGIPIGLVTLEDILEEIVGEIYDEDDDGQVNQILSAKARLKIDLNDRK